MGGLLGPNFVLQPVSTADLIIASLAWGFTLGIGWLTAWTAIQQSHLAYKRRGARGMFTAYVVMIWSEILVCLIFGIICFMHLLGVIPPSFAFYFIILTTWALQVQFLLQIIINRCAILMTNRKSIFRIKYGVAALITAINISVYCIWVPARLQINESYIHINEIWDRCEKAIYLVVDALLNILFIRIVNQNLVENGLLKYRNLVKFNMFIIGFSLSMDVLIIAMMSLENTFVYMQFHPLAYIVKLNIEMSMASLIAKIAKSSGNTNHGLPSGYNNTHSRTRPNGTITKDVDENGRPQNYWATVTTTVEMTSMKAQAAGDGNKNSGLNSDTDELIGQNAFNAHAYSMSAAPSMGKGRAHTPDSSGSDSVEIP